MMGFLLVLILINLSFLTTDYENDINNEFSNEIDKNLKISGISGKIHINNNWSDAKTAGICTGSGTYTDPYVIEDLIINSNYSGNCILIENSNIYFMIENCTLYSSGHDKVWAGIRLHNVKNGILIDNNCSFNVYGIALNSCNNNTITNNHINDNKNDGINLVSSHYNNISENIVHQNGWHGIGLGGSNNTIIKNSVKYNDMNGIDLQSNKNNIIFKNNISFNKRSGIYLYNCEYNNISNNNLSHNQDSGIKFDDIDCIVNTYTYTYTYCNHSIILGNIIINSAYGIYLSGYNNSLSENLMHDCGIYISRYMFWSEFEVLSSYNIDDTNLVNEKPIYYYVNQTGLNSVNFSNGGQVILINCNNSLISSLDVSFGTIGFTLYECENITISNSNASNNSCEGISMTSCDNNSLVGNTASNNYNGIYLSGYYNNISDNIISSNEKSGVKIYGNNITVSNNTLLNNNYSGIHISGYNNSITTNLMKECGVYFAGSIKEISSCNIDITNLVNERPLYYYINESWLGPDDFLYAGQVILINCNDSMILNLNVSHGSSGITLYGCHNNTISNIDALYNNIYGLFLDNCDNNSIYRNLVSNKADYGIGISLNGNYNNLTNNQASNNYFSGISLCGDYNILSNNNASNNFRYGLYLTDSAYNLVLNNIIENNFKETSGVSPSGLRLKYSDNNIFASNRIKNNHQTGLSLDYSNNNTFTLTNITNNKYNGIISLGKNNTFRENIISNNYGNGITLIGSDNNKIIENSISNNSEIGLFIKSTYSSGENSSIYHNTFQDNGINAEDNCINNKWDDGNIGNYWDDYEGIDANDDGIGDTPYNITGSAGTQDNYPIWDDGDNIPPIIQINSPKSDDLFGTKAPNYNVLIIDVHLEEMWYNLNGGTDIFFTENGTLNQFEWNFLPDGLVTIRFYANDTAGNIGFSEVTIRKDINAPIITINNPHNNDVIGATAPNFNISINEPNLDTVWYSLNGGTNITFTGLTGTINQALWDALPEGNVTIRFYANNSIGNIGFQEVTVVKEITQTTPPGIPGYDLLFLLGIMSAVAIIIINKRLNHLE